MLHNGLFSPLLFGLPALQKIAKHCPTRDDLAQNDAFGTPLAWPKSQTATMGT